MSCLLCIDDLIECYKDTGLFGLAELVVDSTSESLHGRGKAHVRVYKRRDVLSKSADFRIETLVVILEFFLLQDAVHI